MVTGTASTSATTTTSESQSCVATQTRRTNGHHGGHGRLGEVAGEVGMERAQAPRGGEGELAGALAGQPAGPEGEHLAQELSPQGGDHRLGGALRPALAEQGQDGAGRPRPARR